MPAQLVLGSDLILNTPLIVDWENIRRSKQQLIDKNNQNKKNRKLHNYRVHEKVLVSDKKANKYEDFSKVLIQ